MGNHIFNLLKMYSQYVKNKMKAARRLNQVAKVLETKYVKPPMSQMLNCFDFRKVASKTMGKQGWSYYASGADDEITLYENNTAF